MREIDYRAWDEEKKKYIYLSEATSWGAFWDTVDPSYPGYILEEYTGLKDKNQKKIYEGDIVKADDDFIYVVEFQDGAWTLVDKSAGQKDGVFHSVWASVSEVIGNIHEHAHLLNP